MSLITLLNVRDKLSEGCLLKKCRIYKPTDSWRKYKLLEGVKIELSNKLIILIPDGFEWDLSSVPRVFWSILPPDGNWELSALIHDFLYRNNLLDRKFSDREMLKWSMRINYTKSKLSFRHFDNYIRFYGVRLFGNKAWKN